ncbi:limonene-1,2-epoxide hydrolase family protein [Rhodococcus sp. 3-2]|uniref:limonene-1,2-epoxide hydrolase family protein n=2 Tax=Nocardiaceae TaxID=85025 RepID=UPI001D18F96A|nr:limonene-1,2-epoxide hydrolase family protein [Rhodococcus sp. 3-2]MCC4301775.1 hypothetical protein [Rhodococcus sp. 3-2]
MRKHNSRQPEYLLNDDQLTSRVVDLLIALEEMDADAVRALVDPDIEWRNTGLPSVRGSKRVELALTIVSRLITRYEVVEVLTMTTDHNTVSSRRREIIRIGWFAMHLDVDGHYTFANGLLRIWDDRFSYRRLLRGLRFGPTTWSSDVLCRILPGSPHQMLKSPPAASRLHPRFRSSAAGAENSRRVYVRACDQLVVPLDCNGIGYR